LKPEWWGPPLVQEKFKRSTRERAPMEKKRKKIIITIIII